MDAAHRSSIEHYNSYISSHSPRAIDYFGRAMDFYTLENYNKAINDIDKAIALTPDFTLAYLLRSQARYIGYKSSDKQEKDSTAISEAINDIDKAILYSPYMPVAFYNKGVLLAESGKYVEALDALTRAIEIKPDFGEAYYNRGFIYLTLGDKSSAFPDLSRAGELGIVTAYPLLKKMTSN